MYAVQLIISLRHSWWYSTYLLIGTTSTLPLMSVVSNICVHFIYCSTGNPSRSICQRHPTIRWIEGCSVHYKHVSHCSTRGVLLMDYRYH